MEGQIIADGKIFRVGAVKIQYRLAIPAGKRAEADRALEIHQMYCPVHQSIQQGFDVSWSAEIRET